MKLKFNLLIIALLSSLVLFNACKKKSSVFAVIPEDTKAVLVFDLKSVLKKADFINIEDYSFFNTAMNEVENENKKVFRLLEDFIEDPTTSGISLFGDSFVYFVDEGSDEKFVVWALPLSNGDKFGNWIDMLLDASDASFDIEKTSNYKYINFDDNSGIAWNKEVAIFVVPTDYKSEDNIEDMMDYLMDLDTKDQISQNKDFIDFYSKKKDVSAWLDYSLLEDIDDYKNVMKTMNMDLDEMQLSLYLEFLDGEIKFTTTVKMPDNKEITDIYDAKFNGDILKYSPDKTLGLLTYAFNPEALGEYIQNISTYALINDGVKEEIGYSIDEILASFGGSFFVNVYDFDKIEVEYTDYELVWHDDTFEYTYDEVTSTKEELIPLAVLVLDLKDSKVLDKLVDLISQAGVIEKHNDYYKIEEDGMNFYFGYNDDVLVVTLDEEAIKNFKDGGYSSSLASLNEGKSAKDNLFYLKFNLNIDDYPSVVIDKITDEDDDAEKFADYWNETFDFIEMKTSGKNESEVSIVLKNDDENSLSFLLHTIDDISKKFL
ncbi:MAG: DUF4836 family protein [Bacteroidales bacterium]|nr:DUF4836 family protein [Bacteroidales bacterium]